MIYVSTPCGRPDNLVEIMKTIPDSWGWIVCYDDRVEIPEEIKQRAILMKCENTGPVGMLARNHILDNFDFQDEDWIIQLDDDNIVHPNAEKAFSNIGDYSDYAIIAFRQCFWNNQVRLQPTYPPKLGNFDTGAYIVNWKYVKGIRYHQVYVADQLYVMDCFYGGMLLGSNTDDGKGAHEDLLTPPPMGIIDKNLSYYNYIEKEDWSHPKYQQYNQAMRDAKK